MFTDCPSCERMFRIRAAQLGAADGWVKCGNCGETFYALERLYDTPLKHPPVLRQTDEVAAQPPAVNIEPAQPVQEEAAGPTPKASEQEQDQPAVEGAAPGAAVPEDIEPEQPAETVPQPDEALTPEQETAETQSADTVENREDLPGLPPVLADENKNKAGSTASLIWGSLVFVLALVAAAQLAWFNRDAMLRAYPALAPRVEQICESLQCEPIRFRDVSAIELLSRQVSQHPRYRNALLASATMVNNAEYRQPFPDIELLIFATDGQVVSHGRFKPGEYLGPDVNPSSGMPPGVPIHFGLDLDGPAENAVSFRFRFR